MKPIREDMQAWRTFVQIALLGPATLLEEVVPIRDVRSKYSAYTGNRMRTVGGQAHEPPTVAAGDTLTFTLRVENKGPANATHVQLADTLPSGLTFLPGASRPLAAQQGT